MQDRYAGDVGDFQKYGLLRSLCGAASDTAPLRLGVCWYLTDDESHNADGKHTSYLSPGNRHARSLSAADPELYDELSALVHSDNRSTAAVEAAAVLPTGTVTVRGRLTRTMTPAERSDWHRSALAALSNVDVVFADPDNGMTSSALWRNHHKYAFTSELADYVKRGQSIVVYHHADRTRGGVPVQVERRLAELRTVTGTDPLGAVIARRGS